MILAIIAYSIQIFCDFSGYTDMAIGIAKCLGFDLPPNFRMPYISRNITEFWKRWHISLSSWLKDYLYVSLGGNRKGNARKYINLMITMLLGGLWHGASWDFVVWGGLHGLALSVHKFYAEKTKGANFKNNIVYNSVSLIATYIFVCICWIFFRSKNFSTAYIILQKVIMIDSGGIVWIYSFLLIIIPLFIIAHLLGVLHKKDIITIPMHKPVGIFLIFLSSLGY